jgi:hypothetical protein
MTMIIAARGDYDEQSQPLLKFWPPLIPASHQVPEL